MDQIVGHLWETALTVFLFMASILGTLLWKSFTRWMEAFDKKVDQLEANNRTLADSDKELAHEIGKVQIQMAREFVSRAELDAKIDKLDNKMDRVLAAVNGRSEHGRRDL